MTMKKKLIFVKIKLMNKKFYLTTAIPYVNSRPHIGHALEFVQADCISRYHKLLDEEVCLLSGADENALKNVQAAESEGIEVHELVDRNAKLFQELADKLLVKFNVFQKGSDRIKHFKASQYLWDLCEKNNDIYKNKYEGLYCVGCEAFYTPEELDEKGECFEHPGKKLEKVAEENYYFKLSKYQNDLRELILSDKLKIVPQFRKNEMLSFLKQPLLDISISRTNERAKNWGVPVPNDPKQRIYVWFDALNIYQSGVGFFWDQKNYDKWWPADLHVIGKGILRFHAIYWPAFLLSAQLPLPKSIFAHGYLTVNGQKMSKTVGNIVDPLSLIEKYGIDALRYYLLREIPAYSDGDFSESRFKELYNADLANGLGNLVARVLALVNKNCEGKIPKPPKDPELHPLRVDQSIHNWKKVWEDIDINLPLYRFDLALESIWKFITEANKYIDRNQPWKLAESNKEEFNWVIYGLLDSIHQLAWQIFPFLPETSLKIAKQLNISALLKEIHIYKDSWINIIPGTEISISDPLFPRIK